MITSDLRSSKVLPFIYLVSSTALTGNGSSVQTLAMQADSEFELHQFAASSSIDAAANVMPNNFSVQITDLSTGRQLMSARIPQRVLCGPANGGFGLLRRPIIFAAQANLSFDFLDLSGSTNTVSLCLIGYKLLL